jgi:hypothetical protein
VLQRWFSTTREWLDHSTEEPLRLVRLSAGMLALGGTCLALAWGAAVSSLEPSH